MHLIKSTAINIFYHFFLQIHASAKTTHFSPPASLFLDVSTVPGWGFWAGWGIPADELLWGLSRRPSDPQHKRQGWELWTGLSTGDCPAPRGLVVSPHLPNQTERSCWNSAPSQSSASHLPDRTQAMDLYQGHKQALRTELILARVCCEKGNLQPWASMMLMTYPVRSTSPHSGWNSGFCRVTKSVETLGWYRDDSHSWEACRIQHK